MLAFFWIVTILIKGVFDYFVLWKVGSGIVVQGGMMTSSIKGMKGEEVNGFDMIFSASGYIALSKYIYFSILHHILCRSQPWRPSICC